MLVRLVIHGDILWACRSVVVEIYLCIVYKCSLCFRSKQNCVLLSCCSNSNSICIDVECCVFYTYIYRCKYAKRRSYNGATKFVWELGTKWLWKIRQAFRKVPQQVFGMVIWMRYILLCALKHNHNNILPDGNMVLYVLVAAGGVLKDVPYFN